MFSWLAIPWVLLYIPTISINLPPLIPPSITPFSADPHTANDTTFPHPHHDTSNVQTPPPWASTPSLSHSQTLQSQTLSWAIYSYSLSQSTTSGTCHNIESTALISTAIERSGASLSLGIRMRIDGGWIWGRWRWGWIMCGWVGVNGLSALIGGGIARPSLSTHPSKSPSLFVVAAALPSPASSTSSLPNTPHFFTHRRNCQWRTGANALQMSCPHNSMSSSYEIPWRISRLEGTGCLIACTCWCCLAIESYLVVVVI